MIDLRRSIRCFQYNVIKLMIITAIRYQRSDFTTNFQFTSTSFKREILEE